MSEASSCETRYYVEWMREEGGSWTVKASFSSQAEAYKVYDMLPHGTKRYFAQRLRKEAKYESTTDEIIFFRSLFKYGMSRTRASGIWTVEPFVFQTSGKHPFIDNYEQAVEQFDALEIAPGETKRLTRIGLAGGAEEVVREETNEAPTYKQRWRVQALAIGPYQMWHDMFFDGNPAAPQMNLTNETTDYHLALSVYINLEWHSHDRIYSEKRLQTKCEEKEPWWDVRHDSQRTAALAPSVKGDTAKGDTLNEADKPKKAAAPVDMLRHVIATPEGKWYIYSDSLNTRKEFIRDVPPIYEYSVQGLMNRPTSEWTRVEIRLPDWMCYPIKDACWTTRDRDHAETFFQWLPLAPGDHRLAEKLNANYVAKRLIRWDVLTGAQKTIAQVGR